MSEFFPYSVFGKSVIIQRINQETIYLFEKNGRKAQGVPKLLVILLLSDIATFSTKYFHTEQGLHL